MAAALSIILTTFKIWTRSQQLLYKEPDNKYVRLAERTASEGIARRNTLCYVAQRIHQQHVNKQAGLCSNKLQLLK